jgi:hypothetical protein
LARAGPGTQRHPGFIEQSRRPSGACLPTGDHGSAAISDRPRWDRRAHWVGVSFRGWIGSPGRHRQRVNVAPHPQTTARRRDGDRGFVMEIAGPRHLSQLGRNSSERPVLIVPVCKGT